MVHICNAPEFCGRSAGDLSLDECDLWEERVMKQWEFHRERFGDEDDCCFENDLSAIRARKLELI